MAELRPHCAETADLVKKAAESFLFVRKICEYGVQVRQLNHLLGARAQINGLQFRAALIGCAEAAHQLSDPGTVKVRNRSKVEQHLLTPVAKQIHEQIMDRLSFR